MGKPQLKPHYFKIFRDCNIVHAFSTRVGGYSTGSFKSLNLGLSTKDLNSAVEENRVAFFHHLNLKSYNLAIPRQIHSDRVQIVQKAGIYLDTDALITNIPGVALTIQTADCFPVFIYEPDQHTCALVHSGWRGTVKNIVGITIKNLCKEFKCNPGKLLVAIGAGIQQHNYQVDLYTAKKFERRYLIADGQEHYKLDIQGNIMNQLEKAGVKKKNIEADRRCTYGHKNLFYSYRRDGMNSGRMMGIISLL